MEPALSDGQSICLSVAVGCALGFILLYMFKRDIDAFLSPLERIIMRLFLVRLNDAALKSYEELRHTKTGALAESRYDKNPDHHFTDELASRYNLYGARAPSKAIEEIPRLEDGTFDGTLRIDGTAVTRNDDSPIWNNLMVRRSDLKEFINGHR